VPDGDDLREVMRRFPSGVAVVTVNVDGTLLGQTVSALVSLSLDPPLVGISIARQAQLHELLREAGGFAVSLLAGGQEWLSQHFARSVPPIAMWHGVAHHGTASTLGTRTRRSPPQASCPLAADS
jgi:flavin reductase (DIM6/NTAB) family NADH-FMN oxidoreductase RutF